MSDNREKLQALVEKWRAEAAEIRASWRDRDAVVIPATREAVLQLEKRADELEALLADQGAQQDETGWLIERDDAQWFTGRTWTKDSTKAVRFFSREDAEWAIKLIAFDSGANIKATEHAWLMRVQTDFHSVNLATGQKTRSIVGEGQRIDEVVGPRPAAPPVQGAGTPRCEYEQCTKESRVNLCMEHWKEHLESTTHQSPVEALQAYGTAKRIELLAQGNFTDEWNKGYKQATVDAARIVRDRALAAQEKPPAREPEPPICKNCSNTESAHSDPFHKRNICDRFVPAQPSEGGVKHGNRS